MRGLGTREFWRGPWPWLGAALLVTALFGGYWITAGDDAAADDPRPPGSAEAIAALAERDDVNVLFVMIDTLRADRLRSYGYQRPTSPVLDALALYGVRFARHLAQSSWTKCSMASLWTARYPQRAGVTRFDDRLSPEARVAAEVFRDAGFRTAGLWRNGWVEGYFGFDQGFHVYARPTHRPVPAEVRRQNPTVSHGGDDLDLVDAAEEFLRIHGQQRWFLYLHLMDLHEYLYDAETAKFGTGNADVYDNALLRTNYVIDRLVGVLMQSGEFADTLIVIGSDHGEAFGERGSEGHARNVYPETTEVPWILALPMRLEPGAVVSRRTANVDIWPTVLDLLGLPAMPGVDGRSRVPEILAAVRGEPAPPDQAHPIAHLDQTWGQRVETTSPTVSVGEGAWRYVLFRGPRGEEVEELFDARRDRRERENRIADAPEVAARLRALARDYLASEPPWGAGAEPLELDEMQLNQLRALGYAVP